MKSYSRTFRAGKLSDVFSVLTAAVDLAWQPMVMATPALRIKPCADYYLGRGESALLLNTGSLL